MINNVTLVGRLTKDPEVKYPSEAFAVSEITIACDLIGKDKKTLFMPVVLFNSVAENVANYCQKGSKVGIVGSLTQDDYEDKDGRRVTRVKIIANTVDFLSSRLKEDEDEEHEGSTYDRVIDKTTPAPAPAKRTTRYAAKR